LEERLRFGSYPEIFHYETNLDRRDYLNELAEAYLYKDIFELTDIRHANRLRDLLKLLAFQIGKLFENFLMAERFKFNSKDSFLDFIK
jgi:predicted AAA+ superfamily ATPase